MERSHSWLLDLAVRTVLSAIIGAFVYSVSANQGHRLEPAQVAGVALMIATPIVLPTAFATNLVLFLVSKHAGFRPIGLATVLAVGAICTFAFPIYMGTLAPATDWQRATLLPLATFLASVALCIARRPNAAKQRFG